MKANPEELARLRHSCAHILAQAVLEVYPNAKLAIGPAIKDGFYYDFDVETTFTEEDLAKFEQIMQRIINDGQSFTQKPISKTEAAEHFRKLNQPYKLEILDGLAEGQITLVQNGPFIDLCKGGHIHSTKEVVAFKLLSVAGAYWRGSEHNRMLQRIYGTAFFDKKELEKYTTQLEEAKKRDHRKLGRQLDLFSFHMEAPGMPFYHPKGMKVYENLVAYWKEEHKKEGYLEIKTPTLLKDMLWKQSGHYEHYKENMFFSQVDDGSYAVKPMNCPGSTLVFKTEQKSYRELPLRLAELGMVHRRERSGVLHGLFRVNAFTIDDAHIFCTEDQIEQEISNTIALILRIYKQFGFEEIKIGLSTRPKESMGSDDIWEKAIRGLRAALDHNKILYGVNEGGGAFYGPKIDFEITDSIGREWQCGTIQLDFQMPERFDLSYITSENQTARPVMVHRAVFGSVERFYGILVEHYAGAFPTWLAPEQVRVVSISDRHIDFVNQVVQRLTAVGIRTQTDVSTDTIGHKIRESEIQKVPYTFVVGDREMAAGQVAVRKRGKKDLGAQNLDQIIPMILEEIKNKS